MTPINDGSSNSPELHSSSEPFDTSQRHSLSSTAAASLRLGVLGVTASSALALGLTGEAANVQPPATSEQSSAISSTLLAALELTAADRTVVQSIQERAKHDPGFRNQLLTNPAAAIQGYKLSTSARNNLITNINKEKAGLIKPGTEESWCVCTGCCVTKINRMPGETVINSPIR